MRALAAFDKFKDAIGAREACAIARRALLEALPDWEVETAPLADGGDGFCETLCLEVGGRLERFEAAGPLGERRETTLGICELARVAPKARALLDLPAGASALGIVELAATSGLALVPPGQRSPWETTTFGLGQALREAERRGAEALLVGLGGSATHDLACGALQALGFRFLDAGGEPIEPFPSPAAWGEIHEIRPPDSGARLPLRIACDVGNPLVGPDGAAAIFGPQKGLDPRDLADLDRQTRRMAILLCRACGASHHNMDTPGAGAAGGAAFGLMTALGGTLLRGAELVFAWVGLAEKLERADLVATGEGRFDASSLQGKGPGALLRLAAEAGKRACVFAGSVGQLPEDFPYRDACFAITPPGGPLDAALAATGANLVAEIRRRIGSGRENGAKPAGRR